MSAISIDDAPAVECTTITTGNQRSLVIHLTFSPEDEEPYTTSTPIESSMFPKIALFLMKHKHRSAFMSHTTERKIQLTHWFSHFLALEGCIRHQNPPQFYATDGSFLRYFQELQAMVGSMSKILEPPPPATGQDIAENNWTAESARNYCHILSMYFDAVYEKAAIWDNEFDEGLRSTTGYDCLTDCYDILFDAYQHTSCDLSNRAHFSAHNDGGFCPRQLLFEQIEILEAVRTLTELDCSVMTVYPYVINKYIEADGFIHQPNDSDLMLFLYCVTLAGSDGHMRMSYVHDDLMRFNLIGDGPVDKMTLALRRLRDGATRMHNSLRALCGSVLTPHDIMILRAFVEAIPVDSHSLSGRRNLVAWNN